MTEQKKQDNEIFGYSTFVQTLNNRQAIYKLHPEYHGIQEVMVSISNPIIPWPETGIFPWLNGKANMEDLAIYSDIKCHETALLLFGYPVRK